MDMQDRKYGGRVQLIAFSLAQKIWLALRALGRAVIGREKFDSLPSVARLRDWKARHWQALATLPDGQRVIYRPHDQCFIDEIYSMRVYDQDNEIVPGQTVVDIGGHIGLFTLYSSYKVGKQGKVVVCEPGPNNFPLLKKNIELNDCPQISAHHCAIADHEGEADFFMPEGGENKDNPATNSLFQTHGRKGVKVPLKTLDGIFQSEGLKAVDLLKVDVEGAEMAVLAAGENCLKNTRRIVMEVHPPRVTPETVYAWLKARGFRVKELSKEPLVVEGRR
jgi:FkbM family methyltransferase